MAQDEKEFTVIDKSLLLACDNCEKDKECEEFVNSIEAVRKTFIQEAIDKSWESYYVSLHEKADSTPPFVSAMVAEVSVERANNFTQTEIPIKNVDVSLSFSKDFNNQDSTSNEHSECSLGNKRYRCDSVDDNGEIRPWKKTKCESLSSSASSSSDLAEPKLSRPSTSKLTSSSETSFKSVSSNHSFKVRKRLLKSDSNLIRNALQRSRKFTNLNYNCSENNTQGKISWVMKKRNKNTMKY